MVVFFDDRWHTEVVLLSLSFINGFNKVIAEFQISHFFMLLLYSPLSPTSSFFFLF